MAPELAAKYPEIRTFRLVSPDDPAVGGRADWTPHGFHAVVRTPAGRFYVDPYRPGDVEHYQVYRRSDLAPPAGGFRDLSGNYGEMQGTLSVFRRTGLPCPRCGAPIERLVVGMRGTHVCPRCQRAWGLAL